MSYSIKSQYPLRRAPSSDVNGVHIRNTPVRLNTLSGGHPLRTKQANADAGYYFFSPDTMRSMVAPEESSKLPPDCAIALTKRRVRSGSFAMSCENSR